MHLSTAFKWLLKIRACFVAFSFIYFSLLCGHYPFISMWSKVTVWSLEADEAKEEKFGAFGDIGFVKNILSTKTTSRFTAPKLTPLQKCLRVFKF